MKFATIERFNGYRFCDDGTAWSAWELNGRKIGANWRVLKGGWAGGYIQLHLTLSNGGHQRIQLHCAIAEAFLGPKPSPLYDCCHNDGNSKNNALSNLRYDTRKGNHADKLKHGRWGGEERNRHAKLTKADVLAIRSFEGQKPVIEIAREYGISVRNAYLIVRRETWKHVDAP